MSLQISHTMIFCMADFLCIYFGNLVGWSNIFQKAAIMIIHVSAPNHLCRRKKNYPCVNSENSALKTEFIVISTSFISAALMVQRQLHVGIKELFEYNYSPKFPLNAKDFSESQLSAHVIAKWSEFALLGFACAKGVKAHCIKLSP